MSDRDNIPVLTDLIEKGLEITMSDLGLDDEVEFGGGGDYEDTEIEITEPEVEQADVEQAAVERAINAEADEFLADHPELEQAIRRILDEHTELALQEIKLAIQRELTK